MERLHESSKIFVEHAQHVARIVSNPDLIAMRLQQRAQLWPSVNQLVDTRTRKNQFDEKEAEIV